MCSETNKKGENNVDHHHRRDYFQYLDNSWNGKQNLIILHPDDYEIFIESAKLAYRLADFIGEELKIFEAKRLPLANGAMGLCYGDERRISIRFRARNCVSNGGLWWKNPAPSEQVFRVVAHEVAHLRYPNHSKEFKKLEKQLVSMI